MPPLPDLRQFHNSVDGVIELVMKRYGQECADAAAAPLIARVAELQAERDQFERNRDMWKGQCERQAAQLTTMREAAAQERAEPVAPAVGEDDDAPYVPPDEAELQRRLLEGLQERLFAALEADEFLAEALREVDHAYNLNRGTCSKLLDVAAANYEDAKKWRALSATPPAPAQPSAREIEFALRSNTLGNKLRHLRRVAERAMRAAPASGWSDQNAPDALRSLLAALDTEAAQPSPEPSKPEQAEAPSDFEAWWQTGEGNRAGGETGWLGVARAAWAAAFACASRLATLPPASAAGERDAVAMAVKDREITRLHEMLKMQHAESVELWNALKDLSFECDGVMCVLPPSRETYNRTFAVLQSKPHLSPEALRGYGETGAAQQSGGELRAARASNSGGAA